MRAVDLCCGVGGVTRGMLAAGFDVLGVDVVKRPEYPAPLLLRDVRQLDAGELGAGVDWLHFSPPCERFSLARATRVKDPPTEADLDILKACLRLRDQLQPRFWTCENVRGAVPWFRPLLGKPKLQHGPFILWGRFPPFLAERQGLNKGLKGSNKKTGKHTPGKDRHRSPWLRAVVPIELARPLAAAVAEGCA